jgi:hypothetical protein
MRFSPNLFLPEPERIGHERGYSLWTCTDSWSNKAEKRIALFTLKWVGKGKSLGQILSSTEPIRQHLLLCSNKKAESQYHIGERRQTFDAPGRSGRLCPHTNALFRRQEPAYPTCPWPRFSPRYWPNVHGLGLFELSGPAEMFRSRVSPSSTLLVSSR